jgi:hypothetical protein
MFPSEVTASRLLAVMTLAVSVTGCGLSQQQRLTLRHWLLCDDCSGGELDSVAAIGGRGAPTLARALLEGPLPERRANVRRQLEASHAQLVRFAAPSPVTVSESSYVQGFLDSYVATYQIRAIGALRRIGTSRAHGALREALAHPTLFRGDVIRALGDALGAGILKQSPDSQVAPADALVAIPPSVAVRDSAGSPLRDVRVTFAIDSGGGVVIDSVQRTDGNGMATVGSWRLGATPGRKTLRATAAGRVTRFLAIATP